jgi:hypothetical protein
MNTRLPDCQKSELHCEVYVPKSKLDQVSHQLKLIGKWMGNLLITQSKLKIWQEKDRAGNEVWKVYDSRKNCTVYLASEEEVRIWIDNSFYSHQESQPKAFDLYQRRLFY